jgi:WXXGXW repeat (2 copies)
LARLELGFARREIRLQNGNAGQTKVEQAGKHMTSPRHFATTITAAALAAALIATPVFAQTPSQMGENNGQYTSPPAPPADQNNQYGTPQGQYGAPQGQYGTPQGQYGAPQDNAYPMQYGAPQYGAPQPGAPQDIQQAPPEIPDYQQPEAPGDGYIWTPGYWAWTGDGYEWVQGAWVAAPYTGALWTPGYWGYGYGGYFWNAGYWGPYVGYYGGINYGFGYFGIGFYGGYWGGGRFWYNRNYCNYHGGYGYSRAYNGYSGHPGGASFVHANSVAGGGYRGTGTTTYRGSAINGNASSYAGGASRSAYNGNASSYAGGASRSAYNGSASSYNGAHSYTPNYASAARGYSQPSSSYSGGNYARSYAAPSGGYAHSAPSGGGGGGGSHGGGGGHR